MKETTKLTIVSALFIGIALLLIAVDVVRADSQIVLRPGEVREIDAAYVDRYRCASGPLFVERFSRLSPRVLIRCL